MAINLPIYWLVICDDGGLDVMHYSNEESRDAHAVREIRACLIRDNSGLEDGSEIDGMTLEAAYEYASGAVRCDLDIKWGAITHEREILDNCTIS